MWICLKISWSVTATSSIRRMAVLGTKGKPAPAIPISQWAVITLKPGFAWMEYRPLRAKRMAERKRLSILIEKTLWFEGGRCGKHVNKATLEPSFLVRRQCNTVAHVCDWKTSKGDQLSQKQWEFCFPNCSSNDSITAEILARSLANNFYYQ